MLKLYYVFKNEIKIGVSARILTDLLIEIFISQIIEKEVRTDIMQYTGVPEVNNVSDNKIYN